MARADYVTAKTLSDSTPLCCNPDAIPAGYKERYQQLTNKLVQARTQTEELPDGYTFRLDDRVITIGELGEWISYERRCCPFLAFTVEVEREGVGLMLQGAPGTKQIIRAGLGI